MKAYAVRAGKQLPFIYDHYNIQCKVPDIASKMRNSLGRMVNCLIEALNEKDRIPRLIILIPDWDIVKDINHYKFGISFMLGRSMNGLCQEFEKLLEIKVEELYKRKKGAIVAGEPKFIWVKMVKRPVKTEEMRTRHKFNDAMNDAWFFTGTCTSSNPRFINHDLT